MISSAYTNIETRQTRAFACESDILGIVKFVNMVSEESGNAILAVDENDIRNQVKTGAVVVKSSGKIIAYIGSEFIGYSGNADPVIELRSACVLERHRKQGINRINEIVLISELRKKYSNAVIISIKNKHGVLISRGTSLKEQGFRFYKYCSLNKFLKIRFIKKLGLSSGLLKKMKIVRDDNGKLLVGIQTLESYRHLDLPGS